MNSILVIKEILKENKKLIMYFLLMFVFLNIINFITVDNDLEHIFNVLIGNIFESHLMLYEFLWIVYQIFFFIYIYYRFFTFEEDNSLEFLILRKSNTKIFLRKFIFLSIFNLIFRLLIFLISLAIYRKVIINIIYSFILNYLIYFSLIMIAFFIKLFLNLIRNY